MTPETKDQKPKTIPLVSILIVAYNPGEYLRNTLRSCIEQTYENMEILILDNNSSEDVLSILIDPIIWDAYVEPIGNSGNIFIHYMDRPTGVILFRSPTNLGPYRWLNLLLEKAQWDYIAIQDHDDIWHPRKLEKQIKFLEKNNEYIGCGTQTIMYYEADKKYFEYFLREKNYYTIHPSLIFRNIGEFLYDTSTEYMSDAWSQKNNLCHGEKKIYNLDESLTLHLIKSTSTNYSYRWHILSWGNIQRVYTLHPFPYATLTIGWELMRKILYPVLNFLKLDNFIGRIERIPFRIMGDKIQEKMDGEWWEEYLWN